MNTEPQPQELEQKTQTRWSHTDTVRVGRMFAAAILLGLILRLMAVNAPPTAVAAKESPGSHAMSGAATNEVTHTESRRIRE